MTKELVAKARMELEPALDDKEPSLRVIKLAWWARDYGMKLIEHAEKYTEE